MKNKNVALSRILETVNSLEDDVKEELLNHLVSTKRLRNVTTVYKLNIATKKMLAVGTVEYHIGEKDYVLTLFPDPSKQKKCITSLRDAKPYYPDWYIEDGKGKYKKIIPINNPQQVYINSEKEIVSIGIISDYLSVQLFSSYEIMDRNKWLSKLQ